MPYLTSSGTNQRTLGNDKPWVHVDRTPAPISDADGNRSSFAHQLVAIRDRNGWTDEQLATALGTTHRRLGSLTILDRLEPGQSDRLERWARDLGTTPALLSSVLFGE